MFVEPSRKKKTSTQKNTTSPQWDEELAFILQDSARDSLNVVVKDDDMGFNDKVGPRHRLRVFQGLLCMGSQLVIRDDAGSLSPFGGNLGTCWCVPGLSQRCRDPGGSGLTANLFVPSGPNHCVRRHGNRQQDWGWSKLDVVLALVLSTECGALSGAPGVLCFEAVTVCNIAGSMIGGRQRSFRGSGWMR